MGVDQGYTAKCYIASAIEYTVIHIGQEDHDDKDSCVLDFDGFMLSFLWQSYIL